MSKNLFVTGTGTDVGKTYVTGLIVKKLRETGYRPAYYKAGMSGNLRRADGSLIPGDADFVRTMAGLEQPLETMCPYVYEHAVSPHLAARMEGGPVELNVVKNGFDALAQAYDLVTMEGSGGLLCLLGLLHGVVLGHGVAVIGVSVPTAHGNLEGQNNELVIALLVNAGNCKLVGIGFQDFLPGLGQELPHGGHVAVAQIVTNRISHSIPLSAHR